MPDHQLIKENIPLAGYTTLRIGGPARYFAECSSEADLMRGLAFAETHTLPTFILGGGSNLLVSDEGFPGLVLRISIKGIDDISQGELAKVTAGAGEDWDEFVGHCVDRDLAGIECLSGIPGTVGGTPVQNVGAYGQEVSETIDSLRVYDRGTQTIRALSRVECGFEYRKSIFNTTARDRYIVTNVTYLLRPHGSPALRYADLQNYFAGASSPPSLAEVREAILTIRARKGMVIADDDPDSRSAGSFFKNPVVGRETFEQIMLSARKKRLIGSDEKLPGFATDDGSFKLPAAWLIERAGFHKGYRRGRAGISTKHTLAIVNCGGATAMEVMELVREIQTRVKDEFGIGLRPEPVFLGPGRPEAWGS